MPKNSSNRKHQNRMMQDVFKKDQYSNLYTSLNEQRHDLKNNPIFLKKEYQKVLLKWKELLLSQKKRIPHFLLNVQGQEEPNIRSQQLISLRSN